MMFAVKLRKHDETDVRLYRVQLTPQQGNSGNPVLPNTGAIGECTEI